MNKPSIVAKFVLDAKGEPEGEADGDLQHYRIQLFIDNAPQHTYAVTYKLHDSYYEPIREARDPSSAFAEEITSYGDYVVQAKLRTKDRVETVAVPLAEALEGHYRAEGAGGKAITPAIAQALRQIRSK